MAHLHKLVAALLAAVPLAAAAGYAQVNPPAGFSSGGTTFTGASANSPVYTGNTVRNTASMSVGGRSITMPALSRFASNAPRIAAAALWMHPAWRTGSAILAWLAAAAVVYDVGSQSWGYEGSATSLYQIRNSSGLVINTLRASSPQAACLAAGQYWLANPVYPGQYACYITASPYGYVYIPSAVGGTSQPGAHVPLTETQFIDRLVPGTGPSIMPNGVPQEMPSVPLPVELPVLNPSADPVPVPQPMRIPQGNPVPIPNTDPQQYRQPMVRVTPSPTPGDPWRVDITPEDVISESPTGQVEPEPVTEGSPNGEPSEGDLCSKYPDILACQKVTLGDLQPVAVPDESRPLMITPDTGWGPAGQPQCPADVEMVLAGGFLTIPFEFQPMCMFATGIKPIVIAMGWFAAAMTFFGFSRRGD